MSSQQSLTELEFDLAPAKQTTSLLSLPLEIRQIIYTLVLPAQSTIYPNVSTLFRDAEQHERGRRFRKYERVLGLARTCQSFYIDFLPHYYGAKIFSFENAYDLYRYLHMCGPYRRRWIRNIEFWLQVGEEYWWGKKYWEIYEWAIELLRECPLMRLGIGVSSETVEKAKWPVRGLEGLKGMRLQRIEVMVREVRGWYSHGRGLLEEENAAEETERWLKTRRNFAKQELLSLETRVKGYMMSDADGPESKSDLPSKKDVFASGSGRSKRKVNPKAVVQRKSITSSRSILCTTQYLELMGIPHLTTFLQPYAETESIAGKHVVIDGPGFAYHVYYVCLSARPAAWNPFEAAPSYKELGEACIAWLDGLREGGVEIKKIYFDGFLPPSKLDTRLERLVKLTTQLSQYHATHTMPCRTLFPPMENPPVGLSHRNIASVRSKLSGLPPISFLVPAALEALLDSSIYRDITEVVPGEADLYCAKYLKQHGGMVLTGDSDLLVHDLGSGAVTFFRDIQPLATADDSSLSSQIYQPARIAQRLDIPEPDGLLTFAFEVLMDSHGTFRKLLADSRSLHAATEYPVEFQEFLKEYKHLLADLKPRRSEKLLPLLKSMDPRLSEFVLQFPYLAGLSGQEKVVGEPSSQALHIFLPFLIDCPVRTNAWEGSSAIRQLAYGLINLIVPEDQQRKIVSEHRKQQDKSSGRELQLPSLSEISDACTSVASQYSQLEQALPALSKTLIWTVFAIHQDIEYAHERAKTPLSKVVISQLAELANQANMAKAKSNKAKNFTWDIVQFFAQIQGSYYSFRILKLITALVVSHGSDSLPESLLVLHQQLDHLPKLGDLHGLDHVSSVMNDLGKGAVSIITKLVIGEEKATLKNAPQESRRALKKKRKRQQSAADPIPAPGKPSNPFELLGSD